MLLTAREGWDEDEDRARAGDRRAAPRPTSWPRRGSSPMRLRELADEGVERGSMVVLLRSFTRLDAYEDSLERAGLRALRRRRARLLVPAAGRRRLRAAGDDRQPARRPGAARRARLARLRASPPTRSGCCAPPPGGAATSGPPWRSAAGLGESRRSTPSGSAQIPEASAPCSSASPRRCRACGRRATSLPAAGLIDAAVTATGYDLAVLMRPAGEARFANVRKLMRLAADFEARRGARPARPARLPRRAGRRRRRRPGGDRGRGSRRGPDHDHPQRQGARVRRRRRSPTSRAACCRSSGTPLLTLGREAEHAAGRDAAAPARRPRGQPLRAARALRGGSRQREAQEELRLFHVAATRARERLLLSGVISPSPSVTADAPARR